MDGKLGRLRCVRAPFEFLLCQRLIFTSSRTTITVNLKMPNTNLTIDFEHGNI